MVPGPGDNQVKLRGYRIELEEIDLAVQSIPDVRRAVTVVLAGADGGESRRRLHGRSDCCRR